jgi:hypothetical protein
LELIYGAFISHIGVTRQHGPRAVAAVRVAERPRKDVAKKGLTAVKTICGACGHLSARLAAGWYFRDSWRFDALAATALDATRLDRLPAVAQRWLPSTFSPRSTVPALFL